MKAIIIDDIPRSRTSLKKDLELLAPDFDIVGEADSVASGIKLLSNKEADVVFLDIMLGDGESFEILEQIDYSKFHIVFTTAHNDFALKAFQVSAVDYLLKPIDPDDLTEAIKKVRSSVLRKNVSLQLDTFLQNSKKENKEEQKIVLSTSEGLHIFRISEIIRCESDRNYTKFYFQNDSPLLVAKTLKEYQLILMDYGFERPHQSHIVNLNFIKKYVNRDGGYLVLKDDSTIPVSQRKKTQLLERIESLA